MENLEKACFNCRFWLYVGKQKGGCKRAKGNPITLANDSCEHHKRVSKKMEAERQQQVKGQSK